MAKQSKKTRVVEEKSVETLKRPPEAARRNGEGESNGGVENLDKVRDILFGSQMRDAERRFARLEERLAKDISDMREEARKRMETLETYAKRELQTVLERVKAEQSQRSSAIAEVGQEIKELSKNLQNKLNEAIEATAEVGRELRQEIMDQSKSLRDEIQQSRSEASAELEQSAADLRSQKLDKSSLADLLTEMAARLSEGE
jgi:vacuolar-type H+-ATPase subunit H